MVEGYKKNVNGTITKYVYDNEDIVLEYDSNNNIISSYTHGPGIDEPLILDKSNTRYYYHTDALGSITAITDSLGNIIQSYTYDSFGNIVLQTGSLTQPFTYTGREYDPEIGLHYYRTRYYDPSIGRFLQSEGTYPFGSQNKNLIANIIKIWYISTGDDRMKKTIKSYGIYPKDEDKFKGEYLVILGNKILAHDTNCKKIISLLKRYPKKAIITKVPTIGWKEAMVL